MISFIRFDTRLFACLTIATLICLMGCAEGAKSHHEADHVTPEHWPHDLKAAAESIRTRSKSLPPSGDLSANDVAIAELMDIISWVPEIAANTDLKEQDWLALYQLSEEIKQSSQKYGRLDPQAIEDLARLCEVANEKIPVQIVE